jgi:hypothetical protein
MDTVTLMDGPRELCVHPRIPEGERRESRLPGHGRSAIRRQKNAPTPSQEETWIAERSPVVADYVRGLKRLGGRRFPAQLRKLHGLCHEYEIREVETGVARAIGYGLYDVTRLEGILLQRYGARLFGKRVGSIADDAPRDEETNEKKPKTTDGDDDGIA